MQKVILILVMLLVLTGCAQTKEQEKNAKTSVQVTCGVVSGSGVIYECTDEYVIILTAGHVLTQQEDGLPVMIAFSDDKVIQGEVVIVSETSDIAFVSLSTKSLAKADISNWKKVGVDKDNFDSMKAGDRVFFEGGQEAVLKENWIYVEDFEQYMMLVKGESTPGMSGGGLYDEAGNFVGILCGVNENKETAAVPLSIIMAEYAQYY